MQKNGYTFATVYSNKCVSVFLHQTISFSCCNEREAGWHVDSSGSNFVTYFGEGNVL